LRGRFEKEKEVLKKRFFDYLEKGLSIVSSAHALAKFVPEQLIIEFDGWTVRLIPQGFVVLFEEEDRIWIANIFVYPEYRKLGYGESQFVWALRKAKRRGKPLYVRTPAEPKFWWSMIKKYGGTYEKLYQGKPFHIWWK